MTNDYFNFITQDQTNKIHYVYLGIHWPFTNGSRKTAYVQDATLSKNRRPTAYKSDTPDTKNKKPFGKTQETHPPNQCNATRPPGFKGFLATKISKNTEVTKCIIMQHMVYKKKNKYFQKQLAMTNFNTDSMTPFMHYIQSWPGSWLLGRTSINFCLIRTLKRQKSLRFLPVGKPLRAKASSVKF